MPRQACASGAGGGRVIWPVFECLFGIRPDAGRKTIAWHPAYAHRLGRLKMENLCIGGASFDVASERVSPSHARYTIRTQETGWTVCVTENGEEKALPLDGELSIVMED